MCCKFLMKAETLKALSKRLVRKVPEEVTCVLNWDRVDLQATGGRTFPAGAKLGQRQEDGRHSWELVAGGNAPPRPWVSLCGEGGRAFQATVRKHLCRLLGSPQGQAPFPQQSGPQLPGSDRMAGAWGRCTWGSPPLRCLSFPMCGEIKLMSLSPGGGQPLCGQR